MNEWVEEVIGYSVSMSHIVVPIYCEDDLEERTLLEVEPGLGPVFFQVDDMVNLYGTGLDGKQAAKGLARALAGCDWHTVGNIERKNREVYLAVKDEDGYIPRKRPCSDSLRFAGAYPVRGLCEGHLYAQIGNERKDIALILCEELCLMLEAKDKQKKLENAEGKTNIG